MDPAARSQPAKPKVAQITRGLGAKLELFHAIAATLVADLYGVGIEDLERKAVAEDSKRLNVIAERLRGPGNEITAAAEWDCPAYEAIVRRAKRVKADLVVAERHTGRHIAPWFLHRNDWEAAILYVGAAIARALRATLHAVHAYPSVLSGTRAIDATQLDCLLQSTRIPGKGRYLNGKPPVDAIQQVARTIRADIVVMGALSRSRLKRIFIGNTAESLLDRLTCDVLSVKPAHLANRVPALRRGTRVIPLTPAIP